MRRALFLIIFILLLSAVGAARAEAPSYDESSAVIFLYHRIGEDEYPDSNLRMEQFEEQVKELQSGDYNVLPLEDIVTALKKGTPLPDKAIALTFDGGYITTFESAIPLLLKAGLPFTVFVAPDRVDRDSAQYVSWETLRKLMKRRGVTIGALPASYIHMIDYEDKDLKVYLNRAVARFREELGEVPKFFAYPYGERNERIQALLEDYDFEAAFGQHSGVAYAGMDLLDLPRFSMTESYGDLDRFQLTASALPLPVRDVVPANTEVTDNPPAIGFTVDGDFGGLGTLACFASGVGRVDIERLDNRIEIRLPEAFQDDRARINCTMPVDGREPGERQRWRWFGMLFSVPVL